MEKERILVYFQMASMNDMRTRIKLEETELLNVSVRVFPMILYWNLYIFRQPLQIFLVTMRVMMIA